MTIIIRLVFFADLGTAVVPSACEAVLLRADTYPVLPRDSRWEYTFVSFLLHTGLVDALLIGKRLIQPATRDAALLVNALEVLAGARFSIYCWNEIVYALTHAIGIVLVVQTFRQALVLPNAHVAVAYARGFFLVLGEGIHAGTLSDLLAEQIEWSLGLVIAAFCGTALSVQSVQCTHVLLFVIAVA